MSMLHPSLNRLDSTDPSLLQPTSQPQPHSAGNTRVSAVTTNVATAAKAPQSYAGVTPYNHRLNAAKAPLREILKLLAKLHERSNAHVEAHITELRNHYKDFQNACSELYWFLDSTKQEVCQLSLTKPSTSTNTQVPTTFGQMPFEPAPLSFFRDVREYVDNSKAIEASLRELLDQLDSI